MRSQYEEYGTTVSVALVALLVIGVLAFTAIKIIHHRRQNSTAYIPSKISYDSSNLAAGWNSDGLTSTADLPKIYEVSLTNKELGCIDVVSQSGLGKNDKITSQELLQKQLSDSGLADIQVSTTKISTQIDSHKLGLQAYKFSNPATKSYYKTAYIINKTYLVRISETCTNPDSLAAADHGLSAVNIHS